MGYDSTFVFHVLCINCICHVFLKEKKLVGAIVPRPSPPGTFHMLIGKFSYFVIRFLLKSPGIKFDNEIGKVNVKKKI